MSVKDSRSDWWQTLKPGDLVCTCSRQHKIITRIEDETEVADTTVAPLLWILACFSVEAAYIIQEGLRKGGSSFAVVDRIVYFADGTDCRATTCLDPPQGCLHGPKP
jgi:hypothetical protein